MNNELGSNSLNEQNEDLSGRSSSELSSIPKYLIEDELTREDSLPSEAFPSQPAGQSADFFAPRPALSRGFDANAYPQPSQPLSQSPLTRRDSFSTGNPTASQPVEPARSPRFQLPWHKSQPAVTPPAQPNQTDLEGTDLPAPVVVKPRIWEKQPYWAIAHLSAIAGTLTAAWFLGILAARIVPGNFEQPPLQESILRKSSRLTSSLWNLPQLWQTPTAETRITAIPLPETGPVLESVELSPVERQPLLDELNAVETEMLTLDRRLQTIEKRLGKPPYRDAGIENRLNSLRAAIDPPVRTQANSEYEPVAEDPQARLLEVAKLKIVLPADALFSPGDSGLKETELLNQVLDQLINYPKATVVIRSYSDDQAGAIASREYTLAQAIELSRYLSESLPEGYRWVTMGGGQSQPIEPNDSALARQRNRRIEILVDTR